ncbi:GAF domain-containing protein [Streptomyces chromofuscus]|uniref:GAF domain-containing protein n=1 Tax=Streptomyces chromofuscus TaxID=42881 RepID=A0A7M2T581_STRCW|nr:GAF domain-containing protein [Streptomyces chromofuscus]QOV43055.1 GAF domain-containing protein [Streptomyces chromofuscus]GGS93416.1 histidine kinase [Streptomyces chromofuscus]
MTYPAPTPQPHAPATEHTERAEALRALGLTGPDPELDAFAQRLAQDAGVPYAMVNIFDDEQQFLGLCTPGGESELPTVGRSMSLNHGFCPEVVAKKKALVLPDVFASPRFAGNAVVDLIGIRTYAGAPLLHGDTVLGTVCFVGPVEKPQSTGQSSLALIKGRRDEVMDFLYRRADYQPPQ